MESKRSSRAGFTIMELLVALGILVILVGILAPSIMRMREMEHRTRCSDNLRKLGIALGKYGDDNRNELPRVVYDEKQIPHGYTAYSGSDAADPFVPGSTVSPNDVTASLWLLVRGGYLSSSPVTAAFVCPSAANEPDPLLDAAGRPVGPRQRSNFRSAKYLSYSYASPFSNAAGYGLKTDFLRKEFVLLADMNPGRKGPQQDATKPDFTDGPMELAIANSRNHREAGQNVLYGDMHVEFRDTPYCGADGDNIYTAQAEAMSVTGERPTPNGRGVLGKQYGPAWQTDSYLIPTASD